MLPEVLYELFNGMPRQGPGSDEYTRKAWRYLTGLPGRPRILDIGCGSGMPTLELARISGGQVTAVDNHQPFLDNLAVRAKTEGLGRRIRIVNASMLALPFARSAFNVIWSEGSIFIMGFEKGLLAWKPFLKPGGYLVVSEMAWITPDRPEEIRAYLEGEYPAIKHDGENKEIIRRAGYKEAGSFILPEAVWLDGFYKPYQSRLDALKVKYAGKREALAVLEPCQREIDMFRKYARCYSYVFYIMKPV
jgi:SAM-dependent methyltransferase